MSGLFGGSPKMTQTPPAQVQAGAVETDASNAAMFERVKRAAAYGKQKTMLTSGNMAAPTLERKTLLGSL
jgi:hypothetical protein